MHHGFNYFLANMAFADLLIAVFNVGTSWTFNLYHDWWYGNICVLTSFFGIAPTTVSVFSMMALSWDRCQAVVRPLRKRPLSRRRSLITIAIIWAISTATALPFAFAATVRELYLYNILTREASIRHTCAAPAHPVSTDMAAGSNSKGSNHTRAKNKAVKMLSLMVVTFMFCWLPYHLYHTFELNSLMEFENPNLGKYIYLAIYWIAMSSSAYNPIIYCFANERFRIGFRYVFRWMPMIHCSREKYEYSQLFPERLRSMAISLQANNTSRDKDSKRLHKSYNSAGFSHRNGVNGKKPMRRTCSTSRTKLTANVDI
ncbi:7 transmembrane receptor [Teladorsagia circumcincta]|nr:7 transmembrane receptor [Teladorsagia circumcincta]